MQEKGYSIIPLKVYLKDNHAKVLIGLCKGKKLFDNVTARKIFFVNLPFVKIIFQIISVFL